MSLQGVFTLPVMMLAAAWGGGRGGSGAESCNPWSGLKLIDKGLRMWTNLLTRPGKEKRINNLGLCY